MKVIKLLGWILTSALWVSVAQGEVISSWGDGTQGTEFDINDFAKTITILQGNGNTYKFFSETFQNSGVPGVINNITVDTKAAGDFTIWIQNDPTGAGASDVEQMNLQYPGGTSNLAAFRLSGDLGQLGPATLETLNGDIVMVGDIFDTLTVETWGTAASLTAQDVVGTVTINDDVTGIIDVNGTLSGTIFIDGDSTDSITIDTMLGTLQCTGSMDFVQWQTQETPHSGTLTVAGSIDRFLGEGNITGTITVSQDVTTLMQLGSRGSFFGTVTIGDFAKEVKLFGNANAGSLIDIGGDCERLQVSQALSGDITIGGNVTLFAFIGGDGSTLSGTISVGGSLLGILTAGGAVSGTIDIGGDLVGQISIGTEQRGTLHVGGHCLATGGITVGDDVKGPITIDGDLLGSISVGGRLDDLVRNGASISVNGSFGSITQQATITLGSDHAMTTEFVAIDFDGWHAADSWINGTVTIENPLTVYTANAPSARIYEITGVKGDMNNDGAVNGGDIDLFFFGLGDPLAYAAAYPGLAGSLLYHGDCNCDGAFNGADITPFFDLLEGGVPCVGFNFWEPEYVAWLIETHVRPDRLDRAIALIDDYTRGEARPDRRRFWNAVLDILAPS